MSDTEHLRVLVTVKAYPQASQTYGETVCVAGVRLDTPKPTWCRLYPVPFRLLPRTKAFKKYDIIEVEATRQRNDPRPESYRPNTETLRVLDSVRPRKGWVERVPYVLPLRVRSMCELLHQQKLNRTSLGIFKPGEILDVVAEPADAEFAGRKLTVLNQGNLLFPNLSPLEKIPFSFKLQYRCDDANCTRKRPHTQSILDWEIFEFYRRNTEGPPTGRAEQVRDRWLNVVFGPKRDPYLFVGNQMRGPQSFCVLGAFWPTLDATRPRNEALTLL